MKTNFYEISAVNGWADGTFENTEKNDAGWVQLASDALEGYYVSPQIPAPIFENLVCCWNATTPKDSWVELEARVYFPEKDLWSVWGSWGCWSPYIVRRNNSGRYPAEEPQIRMNCDILEPLMGAASMLQVRVKLHREEGGISPVLRRITVTLRNKTLPQIPSYEGELSVLPENCVLNTPACSQMIRDPEVGNCICNPTTVSVLLSDRGTQVLPEIMALSTVDLIEGFGNWTYVMAGAGMYGYRAYGRFADYEVLKSEIAAGRSVGVSVHYAKTPEKAEERNLPYLEGAPCNTPGHILTVRGYGVEEGQEYVYVSDSAADSDPECLLRYRKEQFLQAWEGRMCYLVDAQQECEALIPEFEECELGQDSEGKYYFIHEGQEYPVYTEMLTDKKSEPHKMTLMIRQAQDYPAPRMDANDLFQYPQVDKNGHFMLPEGVWTVYLISNTGLRYRSQKKV